MRGREWSWWDGGFFALTAWYFFALVPYGMNLDDEGTLLYQIYRTALGHRLYTDFHAGYTPGVYWWNGLLFRALDVNVLYLRGVLAVINALSAYLIYTLAQRVGARRGPAAVAAWCYVAAIPFYDGQFFSANIPYPIWYTTLLWLLGLRLVVGWWVGGSAVWLFAAGATAGLVFGFKPNSGLLAAGGYVAAVATLMVVEHGESQRSWFARMTDLLRAACPWLLVLGVVVMIRGAGGLREVAILASPLVVLAVVAHRLPAAARRGVSPREVWSLALMFVVGFATTVLPWVVHYWRELGTRPFLRATLFVGTDFERFYFLPYPSFSPFAWLVVVVAVGAVGILLLLRARLLRPPALAFGFLAASVVGAVLLWVQPPPMVEGVVASVTMRVRDIGFALTLVALWGAIAAWVLVALRLQRKVRQGASASALPQRFTHYVGPLAVVLFSAAAMHTQLYPRTDYMHLVPAIPAVLVAGGWVLSRYATRFGMLVARSVGAGRTIARLVLLPVALVIAIMTVPAWNRGLYVLRYGTGTTPAVVRLESPRAPLVVEPAAGKLFLSLSETVRFLAANTKPGEMVFSFPVLDVIAFLADRHNPTRHGYFFPGWPGHEVEAEVIDALRQRPPRYVVTLHDHTLFFATAPVYYFNLRRHIVDHYRWERRIGMFDVLAPRDGGGGTPAAVRETEVADDLSLWVQELAQERGAAARELQGVLARMEGDGPENLAAAIQRGSAPAQRLAVQLVRKSRSSDGAAALALLLERGVLEPKTEELAVRTIAEVGHATALIPLLRWYDTVPQRRPVIAGLLFQISSKLAYEGYWFTRQSESKEARIGGLEWERLAQWADDPFENLALRFFAVRTIGLGQGRAAVPVLVRLVGDRHEWPELSSQAAGALAALDLLQPVFPAVVRLLRVDRLWAAAVVAAHWDPDDVISRTALEMELANPRPEVRTVAYWIAAGTRDPALQPALERGLSDPVNEVRMAAAWGVGELGNRSAERVLRAHLDDDDDRVVTFVRGALAKLGVWILSSPGAGTGKDPRSLPDRGTQRGGA